MYYLKSIFVAVIFASFIFSAVPSTAHAGGVVNAVVSAVSAVANVVATVVNVVAEVVVDSVNVAIAVTEIVVGTIGNVVGIENNLTQDGQDRINLALNTGVGEVRGAYSLVCSAQSGDTYIGGTVVWRAAGGSIYQDFTFSGTDITASDQGRTGRKNNILDEVKFSKTYTYAGVKSVDVTTEKNGSIGCGSINIFPSPSADDLDPGKTGKVAVKIWALSNLVDEGQETQISWNSVNIKSETACSITRDDVIGVWKTGSVGNDIPTGSLDSNTRFTITCIGAKDDVASDSIMVDIIDDPINPLVGNGNGGILGDDTVSSVCIPSQGDNSKILANREMAWRIVLPDTSPIPSELTTVWQGTDIPSVSNSLLTFPKIYTTIGQKTITARTTGVLPNDVQYIAVCTATTTVSAGAGVTTEF